ncbi:MAG: cupin domain-containing protein [Ktedonobacterales bacterium]
MASLEKKNFNTPDERSTFPNRTTDEVRFGDRTVVSVTCHPGWRWSKDNKPAAGTDLCQVNHFFYVISGRARTAMADGTEMEVGPGDVATIPPGHDSWVVGDEPWVFLDLS